MKLSQVQIGARYRCRLPEAGQETWTAQSIRRIPPALGDTPYYLVELKAQDGRVIHSQAGLLWLIN